MAQLLLWLPSTIALAVLATVARLLGKLGDGGPQDGQWRRLDDPDRLADAA